MIFYANKLHVVYRFMVFFLVMSESGFKGGEGGIRTNNFNFMRRDLQPTMLPPGVPWRLLHLNPFLFFWVLFLTKTHPSISRKALFSILEASLKSNTFFLKESHPKTIPQNHTISLMTMQKKLQISLVCH